MIIMIILILLTLVPLVGIILSLIKNYGDAHNMCNIIMLSVFGISLLVCGPVCLIFNSSARCNYVRIWHEQEIQELESTRQIIETIQDDYARSVAITQYNTRVKEYKEEILVKQHYLNNPWISWFNCREYNNFSADEVSYITTFMK